MLTRLRVQGFKNLLDVDIRFGPFTCMAGANGAGKSNIFDAIRFLHLLTQHPIMGAVQHLREAQGRSPEARSLFTSSEGYRAPEIRFMAELIVERNVQDDFGVAVEASTSALEYEVAFQLHEEDGIERLALVEEQLKPIPALKAKRKLGFDKSRAFVESSIKGRRTTPLISTSHEEDEPIIRVHQEKHGGRRLVAPKSSRTVVGGVASSDYPTVLAAHREMQSWQTLLLEPSAMRAPSQYQDDQAIDSRGGNLPATIFRLQKGETLRGTVCAELANRLAELIEGVEAVRIRDDPRTETFTIEMKTRDGVFLPARSLSDGTLRFLVLATLAQDPQAQGMICLEEPENGIHPDRIAPMVQLLRDIAVDPTRPTGSDNPLRQVIVNTHSPDVFQSMSPPQDLVFVEEEVVKHEGGPLQAASIYVPDGSWRANGDPKVRFLAPGKVWSYFGRAAPTESRQMWLNLYGHPDDH